MIILGIPWIRTTNSEWLTDEKRTLKNNTSNISIPYFYGRFFGPKRGKWRRKMMHARMTGSGFTVLHQQQRELQACIVCTETKNFLQQNCNCNYWCHCSKLMTLSGCNTETLTITRLENVHTVYKIWHIALFRSSQLYWRYTACLIFLFNFCLEDVLVWQMLSYAWQVQGGKIYVFL